MGSIQKLHRAQMGVSGVKYIEFADPEVLRVLIANGVSSNGVGITLADAEKVTTIGAWFNSNTAIKEFNEFEKFIGIQGLLGTTSTASTTTKAPFYNCEALETIKLPKAITSIGKYSFANSYALLEVGDLSNVTSILEGAFQNCEALKIGKLPEILTEIGYVAFNGCANSNIIVDCPNLASLGSVAFYLSGVKEVRNLGSVTAFSSPTSGTNYHKGVFQGCENLTKVVLPEGFLDLSYQAFRGCSNLAEINLPHTITTMKGYSFYQCANLAIDVELPNLASLSYAEFYGSGIKRVTSLGNITTLPKVASGSMFGAGVFQNCTSLTEVVLPETLTSINGSAFRGCTSLEKIVMNPTIPPTLESVNAFEATNECSFYVPNESVEAYKSATNWATYTARIKPLSELNG